MVVGQRTQFINGSFWRMPGKWLLGALANYLTGRIIPDLNSGLRRIRKNIALKYLHLCPQGFSFLTTITLVFISRGYNVKYIPIRINKRIGKSKVSIAAGATTLILIFRIMSLFNPLRIFIPVSFAIGVLGVLWGMPYVLQGHGVSIGTMLAIVTSLLFFGLGLICDQISQLRLERFE